MFKFLFIFALSTNLVFAMPGQLIDSLFNKKAVEDLLTKSGILGEDSKRVSSFLSRSLDALNVNAKSNFTKDDLKRALDGLPTKGDQEATKIKNELRVLLDKPNAEIKQADLVRALDSLIYLANKYPRVGSHVISCMGCAGDPLAKYGFKYVISDISNSSSKNVLEKMVPQDSAKLKKYIADQMKGLKAGTYSAKLVNPEDERSLALFLGLVKNGDKNQKALAAAVLEFSKDSKGQVNLLDAQNPHTLYTIFSNDMSPEAMAGWKEMLEQAAKDSKSGKMSKEDAFYAYLKKKAAGNPKLEGEVEKIRARGCFFRR